MICHLPPNYTNTAFKISECSPATLTDFKSTTQQQAQLTDLRFLSLMSTADEPSTHVCASAALPVLNTGSVVNFIVTSFRELMGIACCW